MTLDEARKWLKGFDPEAEVLQDRGLYAILCPRHCLGSKGDTELAAIQALRDLVDAVPI